MQFSNDLTIKVLILFLGFLGFMVAEHIRNHKKNNAPLVCPIGFDCHAVVHSDYSTFLGMPVETLGMIYYACISLAYLFLALTAEIIPSLMLNFLTIISLGAFLFSSYLICVQIFILKKGCSWCIVSALISALIFVLTMLK